MDILQTFMRHLIINIEIAKSHAVFTFKLLKEQENSFRTPISFLLRSFVGPGTFSATCRPFSGTFSFTQVPRDVLLYEEH